MARAFMKVTSSNGVGSLGGAKGARGPAGQGGFSLPAADGVEATVGASRMSSVGGVGSLGALLALQDVGGPLERRKRAVSRAGKILDVLDELKLALIDGEMSARSLDQLLRAVREERQGTEDTRLESILDEIETRAAVELAKLEQAKIAA